jgi:hypothetical protein
MTPYLSEQTATEIYNGVVNNKSPYSTLGDSGSLEKTMDFLQSVEFDKRQAQENSQKLRIGFIIVVIIIICLYNLW